MTGTVDFLCSFPTIVAQQKSSEAQEPAFCLIIWFLSRGGWEEGRDLFSLLILDKSYIYKKKALILTAATLFFNIKV